MTGQWIFICGPSGAGKDSVMAWAQQEVIACKDIIFSRRMVTRPAHAASDHDPVTEAEFSHLRTTGGLAWHWQAHGFCYGIAAHYAEAVKVGRVVVVNGSRAHVSALQRSASLQVVEITAGAAQLATRLSQRGREDANAVTQRLARNASLDAVHADIEIANEGTLAAAGRQLADYLLTAAKRR
ncbi:MAG: Phosphonate metabolism, 1,5-bisphosphokinase (PRPP-forming) PhnN [Polaromonas sp.]|nr:Phosphonate metabolism, 1,5-bisphosphokinase (PRPP-forming) PhnN [Polaromonas sp.]